MQTAQVGSNGMRHEHSIRRLSVTQERSPRVKGKKDFSKDSCSRDQDLTASYKWK